jgi:hypothetical protein
MADTLADACAIVKPEAGPSHQVSRVSAMWRTLSPDWVRDAEVPVPRSRKVITPDGRWASPRLSAW